MATPILIQNRLRILEGNILLIPSCEPISIVTSPSTHVFNPLVQSLHNNPPCDKSYITLQKAREAIPEATVIWDPNYSWRWFVLPSGPPPNNICGRDCQINDWYALLRCHSDVNDPPLKQECSGFSYDLCGYRESIL